MENEKRFFSISEVSRETEVLPHVLRYWEKELKLFRPLRDKSGHRIFTRDNISRINQLKQLLQEEFYTIKGAKKRLRSQKNTEQETKAEFVRFLRTIIKKLKEIERAI